MTKVSQKFLILYPSFENSTTGIAIIKVEGGHPNSFGDDFYDCRYCYWQFQEAVEIIRKQFPIDTGLFQIQDDQEFGHCIVKKKMQELVFRGEDWPESLDSCDSFEADESYW